MPSRRAGRRWLRNATGSQTEVLTHDIDVVMETPDVLTRRLGELGSVRTANGRHLDTSRYGHLPGGTQFTFGRQSRRDGDRADVGQSAR